MLTLLDALGKSIFTACVSSGAVTINITRSTSITSTSEVDPRVRTDLKVV